jgi:hypothetical protein
MECLIWVDRFLPYLIGYITALGLSSCFIDLIYRETWKEIPKDTYDQDQELHRYYGWAIGLLETIIYMVAFLQAKPAYVLIGIWLAFKVAGRWERSRIEYEKNKSRERIYLHVIYSNFTIGNALSIIYSFIGCQAIQLLQKNNILEFILLGVIVATGSFIFVFYAKKQSQRVRKFYGKSSDRH